MTTPTSVVQDNPMPQPPVLRTMVHVEEEKQKKAFLKSFAESVLLGTHPRCGGASSLLALQGHSGCLKLIFDHACPDPLDESDFNYKMAIVMCTGTEHVHVEALEQPQPKEPLDERQREQFRRYRVGCLNNSTIGGAFHCTPLLQDFLKEHAWKKNNSNDDDDSWWTEGQLRAAWKEFAVPRFCDAKRCKGICCALPGDSVVWSPDEYGYPTSRFYKPANQESLIERGYVNPKEFKAGEFTTRGMLWQYAKLARDDPSQLEGDDDEEE